MRVRAIMALVAAAFLAAGCGDSNRVLDARLEADCMLVRERTGERAATVELRTGEKVRAVAVELDPERTRWTEPHDDGGSVQADALTISVRRIRMSVDRPLWRHLAGGALLGVIAGAALSADFDDDGSHAALFLGGAVGLAGGGLGAISNSSATYRIVGGQEPAPPPP